MANNCNYQIQVVGKSKESVGRMFRILSNKDGEFYLYRVFSAAEADPPEEDGGLWRAVYIGDVAWATDQWIDVPSDMERRMSNGAYLANIADVCRALDVGVEVWAEEFGNGIQRHFIVDHFGIVNVDDRKWGLRMSDRDSMELLDGLEDFGSWEDRKAVY